MLPGYLAARKRDVPDMLQLLAAADFNRLRTLAHNLKGSGASYGFSGLTEIGAALEESAKRQDHPAMQKHLTELKQYLDRVQVS